MDIQISGITGNILVQMDYYNPLDSPLECEYEFPVSEEIILSSLKAKIGDREIETIVIEKEIAN